MSKKETWRLLVTPPATGAWNMAVDEALLAAAVRGDSKPVIRLYSWQPACLSLGYAQRVRDVDLDLLKQNGWDLVRRVTGGRAILHTDEITYSVLAPLTEPRVAGTVLESYQRIANALIVAVRRLGIPVEMVTDADTSASAAASKGPVCFEVPSAYELTVDGKKLIGSAQSRRKDGFLQHGAFPLHGDLRRITHALVYSDEQERAQAGEKVLARAATAESVLGTRLDWDIAAKEMVSAFENALEIDLVPSTLSGEEEAAVDSLVESKYANWDWTGRF